MAELGKKFVAKDHESKFELIPKGVYYSQITKSEWVKNKATSKDPKGSQLVLTVKILGPTQKGKIVFVRLNLKNSNDTAVEIAQAELSKICEACGKLAIENSEELHGIPFKIKLDIEESKNPRYSDKNIVSKYMKAEGEEDQASSEKEEDDSEQEEASAPSGGSKKKPWDE